jgi:hypothetical protein
MQRLLDEGPRAGRWDGAGDDVPVTVRLSDPTIICASAIGFEGRRPYVTYRTRLQVMTGDGRVRVDGVADAYAGFDPDNTFYSAWVYIYEQHTHPAQGFAAATGISGVDFGALAGGRSQTDIHFAEEGVKGLRAQVVVEGIDRDGTVTGELTSFKWGRDK